MGSRISKQEYYNRIAFEVSQRSTCLRVAYGAVIVRDDKIMSTGYNGAPHRFSNCCDMGICTRQELKVPHGERYELCRSVHAEANAIIAAGYENTKDSTLYLAGFDRVSNAPVKRAEPCLMCRRMIVQAGISKVVSWDEENKKFSVIDTNAFVIEDSLSGADSF